MSEYKTFNETETERNLRKTEKTDPNLSPINMISESINIDEDDAHQIKKHYKEKAYAHYKQHGNLNELLYTAESPEVKIKLEKWMKEFYQRTINEKKYLLTKQSMIEENKGEHSSHL